MRGRVGIVVLVLVLLAPGEAAARSLDEALRSVVSVLPEWPASIRRTREPEGSGVVVFDGRTILTAAHVVNKALSVRVRTSDGEILPASIRGRDLATDLAVLTVETALAPIAAQRAESQLGDKVCAIGNALGQGLSVTCGVVSGLHRAGVGFNPIEDFVQTDAAVNPGASGGALLNAEGELVGLLSAILNFNDMPDANVGMNFAVSAPLALNVARQLRDNGRVRRPISGLRLVQVPGESETGRLGARVMSVRPGALGDKAGFKTGDVIFRAGARRVRKPADFASAMAELLSVDALEVEIERDGAARTLRIEKAD